MSTDDFFDDANFLYEKWLEQPFGDLSVLSEFIDSNNIFYVKKAFLEGYQAGFNARKISNWRDQSQK
jgi:hypothetical protein